MIVSDEIIKVLDYLCNKIGFTIDWTSANVVPYVEQLCGKLVEYEFWTSVAWIVIVIVVALASLICLKFNWDGIQYALVICIFITMFIVVGQQTFDIIECKTFPEKTVYDYITYAIENVR